MKTIAIGDVHGCFDELLQLLAHLNLKYSNEEVRYVFLGDYVDRGPKVREVVQYLIDWQARDKNVICLKGNHEDMLLQGKMLWLQNGGAQTIASYDVQGMVNIPAEHRDWMANLPLFYIDPDYNPEQFQRLPLRLFVHAGLVRNKPMSEQKSADLIWIREEFLHDPTDDGRYVVHGHTPFLNLSLPRILENRCNLDTGCVFGGALSAAVFNESQAYPEFVINHRGESKKIENPLV